MGWTAWFRFQGTVGPGEPFRSGSLDPLVRVNRPAILWSSSNGFFRRFHGFSNFFFSTFTVLRFGPVQNLLRTISVLGRFSSGSGQVWFQVTHSVTITTYYLGVKRLEIQSATSSRIEYLIYWSIRIYESKIQKYLDPIFNASEDRLKNSNQISKIRIWPKCFIKIWFHAY